MFKDFYEAWHYLDQHPIFQDNYKMSRFQECLDIHAAKVNKKTRIAVDNGDEFNEGVETEIWLECGPYNEKHATHDIALDCGGPTFETAILKLGRLVKEKFGDYHAD